MDVRQSLVRMIRQLLKDMQTTQHEGTGYYTCTPFVRRYNKLLGQARALLSDDTLIATFDDIPESDPKDPSDKMKVLQGIHIESGQLITLLESEVEDEAQ